MHTKFPQPELGPWVEGSKTVGTDYTPPVLEGWEKPGRALNFRAVPGFASANPGTRETPEAGRFAARSSRPLSRDLLRRGLR